MNILLYSINYTHPFQKLKSWSFYVYLTINNQPAWSTNQPGGPETLAAPKLMLSQYNKSKVSAYGKQSEAVSRKSLFWTSIPCRSTALHCWRAPSSLKFSRVLQTPPPSSKLAAGAHQMSPFMPSTSDLAPIVYEPMDVSSISAPSRTQQRLLSALNGALSLTRCRELFDLYLH